VPLECRPQDRQLLGRGLARREQHEGQLQPLVGLIRVADHPLGQDAGRLDVGLFIEQCQGLERRVGACGANRADLARCGIERCH
jgi:hypothetical protein